MMRFEEQYRQQVDRQHAPAEALARIKRAARVPSREERRRTFTRYAAAAAAAVLVLGGALGVLLRDGGRANELAAPQAMQELLMTEAAALDTVAAYGVTEAAAEEEMLSDGADAGGLTVPADHAELYERISEQLARAASEVPKTAETPRDSGEVNAASAPDAAYSDTNVQVAGIDEADFVKTDGRYLYYLSDETLVILSADGADTALVSRTAVYGKTEASMDAVCGMYLCGDRLVLLAAARRPAWDRGGPIPVTYARFYDISDRSAPKFLHALGQSGRYVSSRVADGTLCLVTTHRVNGSPRADEPRSFCPMLYDGTDGTGTAMAAADIRILPETCAPVYTLVRTMKLTDAAAPRTARALLGGSDTVYMDGSQLIVAATDRVFHRSGIETDEAGRHVRTTTACNRTQLARFAFSDGQLESCAAATLPGRLLNQFALDAHDGVIRAVTTVDSYTERLYTDGVDTREVEETRGNCLYTLDGSLRVLGKLEGLAEDEEIKSVRFDGDTAYVVTFRQTDPLFSIDLSDPRSPQVLGALKIPGFSAYLHPFGAGRLLGIGYRADAQSGITEGVKLSMFDVSDPRDVKELAVCAVPAVDTDAGRDHHAVLADANRDLIAFLTDAGCLVYTYTDAAGFVQRAWVFSDAPSGRMRALYVEDALYVLREGGVQVLSMQDWQTLAAFVF